MNLSGNVVLITGGSRGIGLAFAHKLLDLGNEVIVTGRAQSTLDEVKQAHPDLHIIRSDISKAAQVAALARQIRTSHPGLNVLFNNAGVMVHRNLAHPVEDLEGLTVEVDTNLSGSIRVISALIDVLTANRGTIINVSSGLAYVPLTSAPIYCATKAAIHSFTISLRFQLQSTGVKVVELMPPAVKTDLLAGIPEGDVKLITTDELVSATLKGLRAGHSEIRPGQANQLHWMSRIAPGFINGQLYKGSKALIPPA
jgi:uncharacterized oxidoreductase